MFRGGRWYVGFYLEFYSSSGTGMSSEDAAGLARCGVCFDVKDEDGELEEGTDGIGACMYYDDDVNPRSDANWFGRVEATGSNGFKFLDKRENDWDTDAGFLGETSYIYPDGSWDLEVGFVSEPLNYN